MRYVRNVLVLLALVMSVAVVGANAQSPRTPLEREVFKQILTLPYYGVFDNIGFEVNGGTVTLSGKVWSLGTKNAAERTVKRIAGVDQVINNIEELPVSGFDDRIRRQLIGTFSREGGSLYRYLQEPNPSMRVIVENGRVTLEGVVANKGDRTLANILANGVNGVFSVTNNLVVDSDR